jgi:hypothetical protein
VRQLKICGETFLADSESVLKFREQFQSVIKNEGLSYELLYNCDEIGFNFNMLPLEPQAFHEEKLASGCKGSKE